MSLTFPATKTPGSLWPRRTRAEELRLQLADDIVRGTLAPGSALDEIDLARRFGVSRTPVREAIRMLAASGLVDVRAHRSAVVARPTRQDLIGMFEVMAEFESLCAGYAAERISVTERRALEDVHERLRPLIQSSDAQRYYEGNETFHPTIYDGAHNSYLAELTLTTRARATVPPGPVPQRRTAAISHAEHDRIVHAILRGERLLAAQIMYSHITTVRDEFEHYTESF